MRIAIFSDVHGNLTALEAVLQDIKKQSPDLTFFAGDLCVYGARPAECVQRLREGAVAGVYGNTDSWISSKPPLPGSLVAGKQAKSRSASTTAVWAWSQLSDTDRAWLQALPFQRRFSPTGDPQDDLLVVHANPQDVDQVILPTEPRQIELFGEVKQPDNSLRPLLEGLTAGIIAFGHVHIPGVRLWRNLTLANISSVSLPRDGDVRAKYGLLTWDRGWTIEHKHVVYDVDEEVGFLSLLKPPQWQNHSRQLQSASPR